MASYSDFGRWLSNPPPGEEVVVSGISGRFPESNNVYQFRDNLFNKKDMITDDDRRWKVDHLEIPQRNGKIYDIDKLDAGFFGLHYRQTDIMDPLMRKFLETAIEAIMDAGLNPSELEGSRTGVFVGACFSETEIDTLMNVGEQQNFGITGYTRSLIPRRLCYYLKLKGPAFVVDSACSSSSNAIETGFRSIRMGKCDNAIIGGVNLLVHPEVTRQFFRLGVLSPEGTCKVFDQEANGYVKGEAIACVFLQKLKNARRVYGQIIHSKVNDDGYKSLGITYPCSQTQATLITEVLQESGIEPSEIDFVEAHGTGTPVGDPEETNSIDCAIARKRNEPLMVGSVKSSIGHTEASSGLCGLTKVLIALETGHIPPNIHLNKIKAGLEGFEQGRMIAVTELTGLGKENAIIAINNFGFGGNNVHTLVKRFNKIKKNGGLPEGNLPRLVCVSGRTKEATMALLENLNVGRPNNEFIRLLHQIHERDVRGHLYRGFTILSTGGNVATSAKPYLQKTLSFYVFFGQMEGGYKLLKQLMEFTSIRKAINKVNNKLNKNINKYQFAAQIAVVEILKLLGLKPIALYGDPVGQLVAAYYYDNIGLEEALHVMNTQDENQNHRVLENYKKCPKCTNSKVMENKNSMVLNVSDNSITDRNELLLNDSGKSTLLDALGRLYCEGYNFKLHKLYPEVKFPVNRGTPMISPLIKWDYRKSWYTFKYNDIPTTDVAQALYDVSITENEDQKYLAGHVIDGRNLIPATEYLNLVWQTFTRSRKKSIGSLAVVFERCEFIKAVTIPKNGKAKLIVSIEKGSGSFEILQKDSVVVTGRILSPPDIEQYKTDIPAVSLNQDDPTETLEEDEIYRELHIRGYNYSGLFKGIVNCNVEASSGLIRWTGNWTTFMDNMLQFKIISIDTRLLYVPITIQKLVIDPENHLLCVGSKQALCPIHSYNNCNIIKSGGIEICGLKAASITRRISHASPVLEKYVFIPNVTRLTLDESVRVNVQIILENTLKGEFTSVEIFDEFSGPKSNLISPVVRDVLDQFPAVSSILTVSTTFTLDEIPNVQIKDFVATDDILLIITSKCFERPNFLKRLKTNSFLLTREEVDIVPEHPDLEIITEHIVNDEKFMLLRKSPPMIATKYLEVSSTNFDWLPDLKQSLNLEQKVVIYNQNSTYDGIIGFANCLRREPGGNRISCFFVMDDVPNCHPHDSFYSLQMKKGLAMNVYKDGAWGTFRHLLLEKNNEIEREHFYVNTIQRGDLSNLKWLEGTLSSETKLTENKSMVFVRYAALNFRDVVFASGRVNVDTLTTNRLQQECVIGCEFSGVDDGGRRVAGMGEVASLASIVAADKSLLWQIPDEWSLEDAATVTVVYSTVIYALLKVAKIKSNVSILIHSATGGVGLAALNVCLYYGCEIYITVGTQEKVDYIRKHFPQIPESHIGNSRDGTFEEMIKKQTKGRGVDIILNSLSEEKLRASVRCLASGGNFIEIGKFDLGVNSSLSLMLLEKNVTYQSVMLDQFFGESSSDIKNWLINSIKEGIKLGYIKPLPRTTFEKHNVENAFRYMTTGKHIGKVLLKIRSAEDKINKMFRGAPRFCCDCEKTYIIIGGLGGFGLELADWLYLRGVRKLILVSRSGIRNGYQKQRLRIWKSCGVVVHVSTKDVTTQTGCMELIEEANNLGPVDAIFNLAVILKDCLFEDQTRETFNTVLAPKARTTIFMDKVSRLYCPQIRYFVTFSSISCGRGNPGQTNYGMANSVMERICEMRKRDGLPGLAIQWGAIGDVGLVAKMQSNKELVIGGTLQQRISNCLDVLDTFLAQDNPVVASMVVAKKDPKSFDSGSPVEVVAYILGIKDLKSVNSNTTLAELGLDSMTGTEVIQIFEKQFEIYLTAKEIRNMTLMKLMQLESGQVKKNHTPSEPKAEISIEHFLKYIPRNENLSIAKLQSRAAHDEKATSVFLLPGIEGSFKPLELFIQNLNAHVFGIHYSYDKPEDSVEECSENILQRIEEILTKQDTFLIISYSFGTDVGIELVRLLETRGHSGKLIAIDGSPEYLTAATKSHLPANTEAEFEVQTVLKSLQLLSPPGTVNLKMEYFEKCRNFHERLELALSLIPPNVIAKDTFDEQAAVVLHKRFTSMVNYKFKGNKIKSPVHLLRATYPLIPFDNDYKLSEICEKPVSVEVLKGDHSSIINELQLAESVNNLISAVKQ